MTREFVPAIPRGFQRKSASAIRAPAEASGLAQHVKERTNWLLAQGGSQVFNGAWPSSVTAVTSRVYHRRSDDADRLLVVALIERAATGQTGTLSFTPSGGSASSKTVTDDAATTPWGEPGWQIWYAAPTLVDTGLAYHTVTWTNLHVRGLLVLELARDVLDSAESDKMLADRDGSYAGLSTGRFITEGSTGSLSGIPDVLAAIALASGATKRHGGGIIMPDDAAWGTNAKAWTNIADPTLGTSGFGFPHRARQLRSATTTVEHEVRIRARYTGGSGSGDVRVRSEKGGDTVPFTVVTSSWAWYAPDGGATLAIAADQDDTIVPEGIVTDGGTTVQVSSIQYLE